MNKFNKLAIIASSLIFSQGAFSAADPFFTITEISTEQNVYAHKLAEKNETYTTVRQLYDWWSYYEELPNTIDLSNRYGYNHYCFYDGSICDFFYDEDNPDDGRSHSFFKSLHENKSYMSSLLNNSDEQDIFDGIRRDIGVDGQTLIVGYNDLVERKFEVGSRQPVVWSNGTKVVLNEYGFGQASSSLLLDDGNYLIGGSATNTHYETEEDYYYCFDEYKEYFFVSNVIHCPAYSNEPTIWSFDPSTNKISANQIFKHYRPDNLEDTINTADIVKIVKGKNTDEYLAFGFSSTEKTGYDSSNIATFWSFKYFANEFSNVSEPKLPDIDKPGENDQHYNATWFVDANDRGYAIGNVRYSSLKNNAYPVEMFLYDYLENKTSQPLEDIPFYGATSRVIAINNNNLIVGVMDNEKSNFATARGNPRETNGFVYSIKSNKHYIINDYICSDNDCAQNGVYYYVYNVADINDNNVIIANAYRYDTKEDWNKFKNAKNVTIKLTSDKFIENEKGFDVDSSYKANYNREDIDYGSDGKSGGSFPIGFLLFMVPLLILKKKFLKK